MAEAGWSRRRSGLAATAALAAVAAAIGVGGPAGAGGTHTFALLQSTAPAADVSANWAGYAVTGSQTTYTSATATWVEPTVTCGADDAGAAAAFWVGLGGYNLNSQALEQAGTASDCSATTGEPTYYAWYELVPNPSVTTKLKVDPGDLMTTSVNVLAGDTVELQIKDRTRHTTFTTKLPFSTPDLSSAEWIAEAPSGCDQYRCQPIPLSDFGSVGFTRIAALGNGVGRHPDGEPRLDDDRRHTRSERGPRLLPRAGHLREQRRLDGRRNTLGGLARRTELRRPVVGGRRLRLTAGPRTDPGRSRSRRTIGGLLVLRLLLIANGLILIAIGALYAVYGSRPAGLAVGIMLVAAGLGLFACVPLTDPYRRRR